MGRIHKVNLGRSSNHLKHTIQFPKLQYELDSLPLELAVDSDYIHPSMQVIFVLVGLFTALVTNVAAQSCPANLNSEAQIVLYTDRTILLDGVLPPAGRAVVDTNLTFFREFFRI